MGMVRKDISEIKKCATQYEPGYVAHVLQSAGYVDQTGGWLEIAQERLSAITLAFAPAAREQRAKGNGHIPKRVSLEIRRQTCERCDDQINWGNPEKTIVICERECACQQKRRSLSNASCEKWVKAESAADAEWLRGYFDRVAVVSLARTPQRYAEFLERLSSQPWPFKEPQLFKAVDGNKTGWPKWWDKGGNVWGCARSHLAILEQALNDDVQRILIMEDDCAFFPDLTKNVADFLSAVPDGWHCLMIGGQLQKENRGSVRGGTEAIVKPNVAKVTRFERTHCYALSRDGMKSLYAWWNEAKPEHCDWRLGEWQLRPGIHTYRPKPIIAYQAANTSTIKVNKREPGRSWDLEKPFVVRPLQTVAACVLRTHPSVMPRLRSADLIHSGNSRDSSDVDTGLADILSMPEQSRAPHYRKLLALLRAEAAAFPQSTVALWHPAIKFEVEGLPVIEAANIDDVKFRLAILNRSFQPWPVKRPEIFYHVACMNNWRDVVTEQLHALASAGLTGQVKSSVLGSADDAQWCIEQAKQRNIDLAIGFRDEQLSRYEMPTLHQLWQWAKAQQAPAVALYLHTKGVSQPEDENKADWRKLMTKHVIGQWRENVTRLRTADIVGVDWQDATRPHFSGNFWMARADWLAKLPDPLEFQKRHPNLTIAGHPWARMAAEMWLGSEPWHEVVSLGCRNETIWTPGSAAKFLSL